MTKRGETHTPCGARHSFTAGGGPEKIEMKIVPKNDSSLVDLVDLVDQER